MDLCFISKHNAIEAYFFNHYKINKEQGPFSIYGWAKSQWMREDMTCVRSDLSQP